jgi:RNA polymerase sigma factor (sigma-70 family)
MDITDKDLLCECLKGREWAWEIFYERFSCLVSSVVRRTASRYTSISTEEEINDCSQFVWASLVEKDCYILKKWGEKCSLATWLRVCGSHAASRYFKSLTKQLHAANIDEVPPMSMHIDAHSSQDTFDQVSRNELLEKILSIVENKLSKQEKLFARLYWFKKLTPDEISRVLGISLENTYILKHRAEKKIKKHIKSKGIGKKL